MKILLLHASLLCLAAGVLALQDAPPPTRPASRPARIEAHIAALEARLPHRGFTIVWQPPFVVVGDESPTAVASRARNTVKWAVDRLRSEYFEQDPDHTIDVWLFKDARSYRKHARKLFGDDPTTPYGYYSPRHRALVMNIATGGGTLVHEIVHPFVAANFPACPAWFNEGLGSLYEQADERDGRIVGLPNWRLSGLQKAIRDGEVPSFERLTGTSSAEFYGDRSGVHYAQARYLLYWLQEHDLLRTYYREFRKHHGRDPSGCATLKAVLGRDLDDFRREWEAFVLRLRFNP
jgi:hypothetical protein